MTRAIALGRFASAAQQIDAVSPTHRQSHPYASTIITESITGFMTVLVPRETIVIPIQGQR